MPATKPLLEAVGGERRASQHDATPHVISAGMYTISQTTTGGSSQKPGHLRETRHHIPKSEVNGGGDCGVYTDSRYVTFMIPG